MHSKRGQAEYVVLVGIILVLLVVAYFALSTWTIYPITVPQGIEQEKKLVGDAVTNTGRQAADEAIGWIENQGGYIVPDAESVVFANYGVAFWQKCSDTSMAPTLAEITARLEDAMEYNINRTLHERRGFFSKNVTLDLDSISVRANIQNNKIDFSVYIPTTIQGHSIPQPYTFSVSTKLGEMHEFATKFVQDNAQKRYFEIFTATTIYYSGDLATNGVLTRCGQGIYQNSQYINKGLRDAIEYTLVNTFWWQPMPPADPNEKKVYAIESLNGDEYPQFDIGLYLPDGFILGPARPLHITNSEHLATISIFDIPICVAPYFWRYSVDYPVIIRLRDDLTGHHLNFAVQVDMKNMMPSDCSASVNLPDDDTERNCYGHITTLDRQGNPLANTSSTFGQYYFGESDLDGVIEGSIQCEDGKLILFKDGYGLYESYRTAQNINKSYTLYKLPLSEFKFKQVYISDKYKTVLVGLDETEVLTYHKCEINLATDQITIKFSSDRYNYSLTNIDPDASNYDCLSSAVCETCRLTGNDCRSCLSSCQLYVKSSVTTDLIPGDYYDIDGDMMNYGLLKATGAFETILDMPESDSTYYVYVPSKSLPYGINDQNRMVITRELKNKCGMDPIESQEHKGVIKMVVPCSCTELLDMTRTEFPSCIDKDEREDIFGPGCTVNSVKSKILSDCNYEVLGCG